MEEEVIPPFSLQPTEGRRQGLNSAGVILLLLLATAFAFGFRAIWDSLNLVSVLLAVVCLFLGKIHGGGKKNGGPTEGVFNRLMNCNSNPDLQRESLNLSNDEPPPFHRADSDSDSDQFYDAKSDDEHRRPYGAGFNSDRARALSEPPQEEENYDEWWRFRDDTNLNGYRTDSNRRFFDDTHFSGYRVNSNSDRGRDFHFSATASEQQQNVETSDDHKHRIGSDFHPPVTQREVKDNNEQWRFYDDSYLYGYGMNSNSDQEEDVLFPPRFYDDTHVHGFRSGSGAGQMQVHPPFPEVFQKPNPSAPPLLESPPLPWPESPTEVNAPPISPPSAQPPPPASRKSAKRRAMDLLASLRRKKKKKMQIQRQNSVENLASLFDPQSSFYQSSIAPPSATPDPPPSRSDGASKSRESKTSVGAATATKKPPKQARSSASTAAELNIESENSSPLSSIPPSPPPPPFGVIPWRFERYGDFVRAASFTSSMCGSSDLDGAEPPGKERAESTSAPSSSSSPDVNVKAGNFIASFRADLRMQKMNSNKARMNSRAGPDYN